MPTHQETLVIGAGPVGLLTAAELYRHGARCRLIEKLDQPSLFCKALGVTPRTLEMFDDLGIVDRALTDGLRLRGLTTLVNGEPACEPAESLADGSYGFLTLAQYDVERILTGHLESLGGQIERGIELVSLEQDAQSVRVVLRHANGSTEKTICQYVVGCDGGRSAVRHSLGVEFEGDHYEQTFMLADIELDWDRPRGFGYKFARMEEGEMRGGGACIPVPGNPRRYRFSSLAPPEMLAGLKLTDGGRWASNEGPSLAQVQEMIDYLYPPGARASELRWSSFYKISHRIAAHYRVGRVFLAGDAAHLHPPIGGQGMNAGLQDAYNLAWKLALVQRGAADPSLLDSYEAERRPIGQQIVERTSGRMNRMMEGKVDAQEPMRDDSQLFLSYRDSPWVIADTEQGPTPATAPRPGDRAPDVTGLTRPSVRHSLRLFDLLRGTHHTLLYYTNVSPPDDDCQQFHQLVKQLSARVAPGFLRAYAIVHADSGAIDLEGLPVLVDARGEFARAYCPQRGSLILIRPDGYLACRATVQNPAALQAYVEKLLD